MSLTVASNTINLVSFETRKAIREHHKAERAFIQGERFAPLLNAIVANPTDSNAYNFAADFADDNGFHHVAAVLRTFAGGPGRLFHGRTFQLGWDESHGWPFIVRHGRNKVNRFSRYGTYFEQCENTTLYGSNWRSLLVHLCFAAEVLMEHAIAELGRDNAKRDTAKAKSEIGNPFKVGDLLYDQFGYDETHYHFAQVVAVGKMSVKIRKIARRGVGSPSRSHQRVEPVADAFLSDEVKTVVVRVGKDSKGPYAYLPSWSKVTPDIVFSETYYG